MPVRSIVDASNLSAYNVVAQEHNMYVVHGRDRDLPLWINGASEKPKTRLQELAQLQSRLPVALRGEWSSLKRRLLETAGR